MKEPYRLFFPLGLAFGIWGAALWILFARGATTAYPGTSHPDLMMGGFLLAFAMGFLMTAIPRFTGSFPAERREVAAGLGLLTLSVLIDGLSLSQPWLRPRGLGLVAASLLLLVGFAMRRFRHRTHQPPPVFVFVAAGLMSGLSGSTLLALSEAGTLSNELGLLGRSLFYQGMMLSFVLGVGSRLVPSFLGWSVNPLQESVPAPGRTPSEQWMPLWLALAFVASFPLEHFLSVELGRSVRAAITTYLVFGVWRIHKQPKQPGGLAPWLRISGAALVIGLWIYALSPPNAIAGVHVAFIGGFSLLTLLIATRVTLAHGGHDLGLERRSRALKGAAILLLLAALSRAFAATTRHSYMAHLEYAAILWIAAIVVWSGAFLPRLRR